MTDRDYNYTTPEEPTAADINRAEDQIDEHGADIEEETNWFENVGPADADPEVVEEELEQYGFDKMERDDELSLPGAAPELPNWAQNSARKDVVEPGDRITRGEERPVEDEISE